jgi:HK97 gp10 family phage protein
LPDELAALRTAVDTFPEEVTARLRAVAWRKSREVKDLARGLAARNDTPQRGRLNTGEPHLADSIVIIEDAEHKQFRVEPDTPWNPNLGLWIERGTVKMRARPFMRPAEDAIKPSYEREMLQAAEAAGVEVFGKL